MYDAVNKKKSCVVITMHGVVKVQFPRIYSTAIIAPSFFVPLSLSWDEVILQTVVFDTNYFEL